MLRACLILGLILCCALARAETLAERNLKQLVEDQKQIFADAQAAGEKVNLDDLQTQVQGLSHRYDVLLRDNPDFVAGYVAYGLMLEKVGLRKEATAIFTKANKMDPNLAVVKNQLGNFLAEDGKPLEAVNYYTAAIELAPREPLYHFQLGTLLFEARDDFIKAGGQWTEAVVDRTIRDAFKRAAELNAKDWRFSYRYGLSFYELPGSDWTVALAFWQEFETRLNAGVERQVCRLHQAKILGELGRWEEADQALAAVEAPVLASEREKVAQGLAEARAKAQAAP